MGIQDNTLQTDQNNTPAPQYFNAETDEFEALRGSDGHIYVQDRLAIQILRRLFNALNFARTPGDQLRVVVDTAPTTTVTGTVTAVTALNGIAFGSSNVAPLYFASGAPNAFDAREQQMILMRSNFQQARTNRWVIS